MKPAENILIAVLLVLVVISVAGFFLLTPKKQKSQVETGESKGEPQQIWGAYTGNTADSFAGFTQEVGKQPDIGAVFLDWGRSFPTDLARPAAESNKTLLIFWEPNNITLDQIISGRFDKYIKEFSMQVAAYKKSVILVPMPEMNGDWNSWSGTVEGNTSEKFIQAWKHTHELFAGASNVKWGWAVNNDSVPDTSENAIANYYPGSAYTDYVGVDGFNFGNPWQTYSEVFSSALQQVKSYGKPVYIFSIACAEGPKKAEWIADALSKIKADKSLQGFIWFNEEKEQNWLVSSSPQALEAFRRGIE